MHVAFIAPARLDGFGRSADARRRISRAAATASWRRPSRCAKLTSPTRMLYAVFAPDGRRIHGSLQTRRAARSGLHQIIFIDPSEGPDAARAMTIDLSPTRTARRGGRQRMARTHRAHRHHRLRRRVSSGLRRLGFGGALVLGAYLQRRLQSISSSAEAIIGGDIRERMPVGGRARRVRPSSP